MWFNLHSRIISELEHFFICLLTLSISFSILLGCFFFLRTVGMLCIVCVNILNTNSLSVIYNAEPFFPSLGHDF